MIYNTEKRSEITSFLSLHKDESFSLEEICSHVLKDGNGKSTVYRLVSKMVEEGSVRRLTSERSRHVSYQYLGDGDCSEHFHLKCRECGRMIHLDEGVSHALENQILVKESFLLEDGAVLFGRCKDCKLCEDEHSHHSHRTRDK